MNITKENTLLFLGDSVTDCGRDPSGEWYLGEGYPNMISSMIRVQYPEHKILCINKGTSGNQTRHILSRLQEDVLDNHPDVVTLCIGINDVWRQFDSPALTDQAVDPVEYEENLRTMIEQAKMVAKGVIVCTPYYMEPNKSDFMRARMQEYVDICERLAEEYGCRFVNFQAVYDKFLQYKHSSLIAWDRVHPNQIGATLMAKEWLSKCGFEYDHTPEA